MEVKSSFARVLDYHRSEGELVVLPLEDPYLDSLPVSVSLSHEVYEKDFGRNRLVHYGDLIELLKINHRVVAWRRTTGDDSSKSFSVITPENLATDFMDYGGGFRVSSPVVFLEGSDAGDAKWMQDLLVGMQAIPGLPKITVVMSAFTNPKVNPNARLAGYNMNRAQWDTKWFRRAGIFGMTIFWVTAGMSPNRWLTLGRRLEALQDHRQHHRIFGVDSDVSHVERTFLQDLIPNGYRWPYETSSEGILTNLKSSFQALREFPLID